MTKRVQIFVAAFASLASVACFAEEIGGAVLPMSAPLLNGDVKAIAQKLRAIKERGAPKRRQNANTKRCAAGDVLLRAFC